MIIKKPSILQYQLYFLLFVGIFNILPAVEANTSSFSFVLVFLFTSLFFGKSILYSIFHREEKPKLKTSLLFFLYIIVCLILLIRNFKLDYGYLRELVISPYTFLPYLLPLFIRKYNQNFLATVVKVILINNLVYVVLTIIFFINGGSIRSVGFVEDSIKYFAMPNFLLMLIYSKLTNKKKFVTLLVFILSFIISILAARRSLVWTHGWVLILFVFVNYFSSDSGILKKVRLFVLTVIMGFGLLWSYDYYSEKVLGSLFERIDADTRSAVETDFRNDMEIDDWIFGKGIGGTYKLVQTDFLYDENDQKLSERNIIESGYQNILLNGGYFLLFIFIIIYGVAVYRGIFRSHNFYAKAFAAFIILHVVESYPAGIFTFNTRFFILWCCIFTCWDPSFLNKKNTEIKLV